jgi:hypothetical protein
MDTPTQPLGKRRSIRFTLPSTPSMTLIQPVSTTNAPPSPHAANYPVSSPHKPPREGRAPSSSPLTSEPEEEENVAGPSRLQQGQLRKKVVVKPRGEKRVLPARLRRAAGGGAEGVRDLEEMIIDWSERYGRYLT